MKRNPFASSLITGIAAASAAAISAYADIDKSLRFIPESVDFGMIREEDGRVTGKVKAVNISPDTTFIISARTSCGCSAAEYPQDIVAPGDTVEVTVAYDPTNRPGSFLKTIRFFTGEERIPNTLKMTGKVLPSKVNLDRDYPEQAGFMRLTSLMLNVGEMSRSESRPMFVGIYNDSGRAVPLAVDTDGAALDAGLIPDTIEPYGVGTLTLLLNGRLLSDSETEIMYKATVRDSTSGEVFFTIPVVGGVKSSK